MQTIYALTLMTTVSQIAGRLWNKTNLNPQKIIIISKTLDFSGFFVIILKFGFD